MVLKKNEEYAIGILKERLKERYSLIDYRIFGSKSRGDANPYSDIDIMIELEESNHMIESDIYDIVYDVNLANDCFITVIIFTRDELEKGPLAESPLYKSIMREGVAL